MTAKTAANKPLAEIDFWFSISSTYSYLTVMRLDRVEQDTGIRFTWQPFNLREITREMNNTPFQGKPVKMAYMWRDLERRAARYGIEFRGKPPYPLKDAPRLNRLAVMAFSQGWGKAFTQAAYSHWFLDDKDVSEDSEIRAVLSGLGRNPEATLSGADLPATHEALAARTQVARDLGVFGAPTFVVGRELFWGDDRLDDAISWAQQ
jgi:2-hydroxychromene-2-carboxylate isomerase